MLHRYLANALIALTVLAPYHLYAATCDFTVSNEWGSGFTSSVAITNDTSQAIDGWTVAIDFAGGAAISGMWDATVSGNSPYQAVNADYNGSIPPGSTVRFGFNAQKSVPNTSAPTPTLGGICGDTAPVDPPAEPPEPVADAQCEYIVRNEWQGGFTAVVKIRNNTQQPIQGWLVSLAFPTGATITNSWNTNLSGNNPYQATHKNYNQTIQPNRSIGFGFNGSKASADTAIIPVLGGVCDTVAEPNQPPVAQATVSPQQGITPLSVNFSSHGTTDPDGDSLTYRWDLGAGATADTANATHTYTAAGTYPASLTVTDTAGNSDTVHLTITVTEPPVSAAYHLDTAESSLHFVSTKKVHVVETHTFGMLSGSITAEGMALIQIDLGSVDTGIAIRDERMRNFLFETGTFQSADITLNVAMADISGLPAGQSLQRTITPTVDLHGFRVPLSAQVLITKLTDDKLLVQNTSPVIVQAADFGLTAGIEILRDLAQLSVISYAVPTNFTLIFNKQ